MINNLDQIKKLLVFPQRDSFYFVQVLQRKKDHPGVVLGGSNNNSRLIKAYYITSVEKLEVHWEEMVKMGDLFNARVSINLNPRSFEKAAFHTLQKIADQMSNKDWIAVPKAYNSVCGNYHSEMDKRWLIDLDKEDLEKEDEVLNYIAELQSTITNKDYNILSVIPSKSGKHIITNPFNTAKFQEKYPTIEVHKNNPTNLYIP